MLLLAYFFGTGWAKYLPSGETYEDRWRAQGGQGNPPRWISAIRFLNPGKFTLKEHAVCIITVFQASDAAGVSELFATQRLFYDLPLSTTTVVLSTISIGLFGYGICGILRPIAVWDPEAVYWTNLPYVKTLQALHWDSVGDSKPIKYFWFLFAGMFIFQIIPGYMFPWLNGVSIPVCDPFLERIFIKVTNHRIYSASPLRKRQVTLLQC